MWCGEGGTYGRNESVDSLRNMLFNIVKCVWAETYSVYTLNIFGLCIEASSKWICDILSH